MIVFFLLLNRFCYMRQIEDHLSGCKWFGTHFKMIVLFDHYYLTEVPTTIIDLIEDLNDSLYLVLFCIAFKSNSSPTFLCELCEILIHFHDKRNHISWIFQILNQLTSVINQSNIILFYQNISIFHFQIIAILI